MAPRVFFVALAAAVLLGGCPTQDDDPVVTGDDPPAETTTAPADPTTAPAEETTVPTGTRPDPELEGPVTAPAGAPGADELATALPELDELPTDVAERVDLELWEREDAADPLCGAGWPGNLVADLRYQVDLGGVAASYGEPEEDRSPDPPPSYLVALAPLPDAGGLVADARAQWEACAAAGEDPEEEWTWAILDWPRVGDVSVTSVATSSLALYEGGPVPDGRSTFTIAAVGDVVILVEADVFSATGTPAVDVPEADLQALVALVVDRVAALR
jgi:hypothetical protein